MKCLYPVAKVRTVKGTRFFYSHACGKCQPCRITRKEVWAVRIMLESLMHSSSVFSTLTYDDEVDPEKGPHMPNVAGIPTLCKEDVQLFMKRLRKRLGFKVRYYLCGEYGELNYRPHYHIVIFGLSMERVFQGLPDWKNQDSLITKVWGLGQTKTDPLNKERAAYVSDYILKKFRIEPSFEDPRVPEFALMSRRPGLGRAYADKFIKELSQRNIELVSDSGAPNGMVTSIRFQGRKWPLGQYLKEVLLEGLGGEKINEFTSNLQSDRRQITELFRDSLEKEKEDRDNATRARRRTKRKKYL